MLLLAVILRDGFSKDAEVAAAAAALEEEEEDGVVTVGVRAMTILLHTQARSHRHPNKVVDGDLGSGVVSLVERLLVTLPAVETITTTIIAATAGLLAHRDGAQDLPWPGRPQVAIQTPAPEPGMKVLVLGLQGVGKRDLQLSLLLPILEMSQLHRKRRHPNVFINNVYFPLSNSKEQIRDNQHQCACANSFPYKHHRTPY